MKLAGQKGLPGQKGDRPKKEAIYDLSKLKNITVKLIGGREVKGTLVGYDALQNLVIENCTCNGVLLGLVVVRGTATFMITGEEPKISVVSLQNNEFSHLATIETNYPVTKLLWSPLKSQNHNLIATTGDYLRLWELKQNDQDQYVLSSKATLANARRGAQKKDYCAPLTSFDWNENDPTMCVTSSIDTTCTVWNVETGQAKTQLIAHDKEVYDVAFARGVDVFASVGADGSVRMFDLRSLEHSTIIYETLQKPGDSKGADSPLLRLAWNKQDPNYLATFQLNTGTILILDIRVPSTPVTQLNGHGGAVNSIAWAPHSSGEDSQALVWDISQMSRNKMITEPILAFNAENEINNLSWNGSLHDWIAISSGNTVQALRV